MLFCCLSLTLMAFAQASGGQIRRPNRVQPNERSSRPHNTTLNRINNHEYVDLGLSVKWATCNVGANSPEDYGLYFVWGETSPRTDYGSVSQDSIRRDIGNNISGSAYDAANANWGGNWRMPTRYDVQELIDNCKWKEEYYKGINGYRVTGPNKKSIFIPSAGYYSGSIKLNGYFRIWTSSAEIRQNGSVWPYHLHVENSNNPNTSVHPHLIRESSTVGMCIRPVIN